MNETATPVNKALIIANVVMFALQWITEDLIIAWLALWPPQAIDVYSNAAPFRIWQLLTYGFLHGGTLHLFVNMFALFMFGSDIERLFGSRRYLIYYVLCVVGAAAMHLFVVSTTQSPPAPTLGASGGVFGLLLAFGMAYPRRTIVPLFPPIPMPAWLFVTLYGLLELYMGVARTQSGVAHFAHLGGMATGFVVLRYWRAQRMRR